MKRKKKIVIPGIGLRIIKSAIAVAICYIINLLRKDQGMVFSFITIIFIIQCKNSDIFVYERDFNRLFQD